MKSSKKIVEINAGSMADIAFLLLVFFLVTTKIETDYGLHTTLPQWEQEEHFRPVHPRNAFEVNLNAANELMVEGERLGEKRLKDRAIAHILNNRKDPTLSDSPHKAIFKFQISTGTAYRTYLATLDQIQGAYQNIWEAEAQKRFQSSYDQLSKRQRMEIRKDYPRQVFESEPKL